MQRLQQLYVSRSLQESLGYALSQLLLGWSHSWGVQTQDYDLVRHSIVDGGHAFTFWRLDLPKGTGGLTVHLPFLLLSFPYKWLSSPTTH